MKNLENLKIALKEAGITSEIVEVIKNNCTCTGMRISKEDNQGKVTLSPIIYYSPEESIKEFVERAKYILENDMPGISIDHLFDLHYIRENVFISVQRKSKQKVVKRKLLNLEIVLRVVVLKSEDSITSLVVTPEFLEIMGLEQDEIFDWAIRNMRSHFIVQSMAYFLGMPTEADMYILTTKNLLYGATALAYPELFEQFCYDTKSPRIWILPSSTQELILLPDSVGITNPEELALMVDEVNNIMVSPEIRLDPVVYVYDLESGCISIAGGTPNEQRI